MKKLFLLIVVLFFTSTANSQSCGTCSINITGFDTLAYTVNAGQTFCVDTTGNFQGKLTLNGGSVCNKGLFSPTQMTLTAGALNNYGNCSFPIAATLNSGLTVTNNSGSILNINGNLGMSGGSFNNSGITNISSSLTNTSGTLTNAGILNCTTLSGSNTVTNTGVINSN